jgi:hypothetical protein
MEATNNQRVTPRPDRALQLGALDDGQVTCLGYLKSGRIAKHAKLSGSWSLQLQMGQMGSVSSLAYVLLGTSGRRSAPPIQPLVEAVGGHEAARLGGRVETSALPAAKPAVPFQRNHGERSKESEAARV